MDNINKLNAGLIFVQSKMLGLSAGQAALAVRSEPLEVIYKDKIPHRPTIVRLVNALFRADARAAAITENQRTHMERIDAAASSAFPEKWAEAEAMTGRDRREAKRLLRRAAGV